ncbi:DUF368 domain-containing protein [Marinobacterium arenosum]|uniref:DUF368 domain-containing protein n=1 Tax=Marinobacterium arenosum TaxID=2862496 RepID=UPI001C95E0AF|nr:DUF368 domain-containing protein [Marinobacterium arenosum]MBY4675666.1 DUF368 domain-containing protein [Marinobacterium arenosum]
MSQLRSVTAYLWLALKGMLMGAADAVPGVSGGTVAFMTGIYEELIDSLRRFDLQALRLLFREGPLTAWRHVNGSFLLVLFCGILFSVLTMARLVLYLLAEYPIQLWALFFGLILASCWVVARCIDGWERNRIASFLLGVVTAYLVTSLIPISLEATPLTVFLAGMLAICAMILPGISGSFILLLLGLYAPILAAIKGFEWALLLLFASGCAVGLLSFSRLLHWLFQHHHEATLALLAGFMLGSLNKVWPWKYTTAYTIDRHGREVALVQENLLPGGYESLTGEPAFMASAVGLMALGAMLVMALEWRKQ